MRMKIRSGFGFLNEKRKILGTTMLIKGMFKRCYYMGLQKRYQFDRWHTSPYELRKYAQDVIKLTNLFQFHSVYEVGCGLGDIIRHINAQSRTGCDISERVIKCAKYLDHSHKTDFFVGSFDHINNQTIDCFISINFIHAISPEELKSIYQTLTDTNRIRYILVDKVNGNSYKYHHDFNEIMPTNYELDITLGPYDGERYILLYKNKEYSFPMV